MERVAFAAGGEPLYGGEAVAMPADRLLVLTHLLADEPLLREQADVGRRALLQQPACTLVRRRGALVLPAEELALGERRPDLGDRLAGETGNGVGPAERALVELRRLEIGPLRVSPARRRTRVLPRLDRALGQMEMKREELDGIELALLEHLGDTAVQLPPALERKALVRAVADQGVTEAEGARHVRVPLHELGEPVPRLRVGGGGRVALEHACD